MIHARHGPVLVVIVAASLWGLFWLPLRGLEEMGLAAGWATLSQLLTPALLLVPLALWRAVGGRATGLGQPATGLLIGGAFAFYAESLLLTEVARALILFYVTPVWSTLLERAFMGRRFTGPRVFALVLGLAGLLVILGGKTGLPLPRNLGDVLALLSGMLWAVGSMRIRQSPDRGTFEHLFSFFVYGGLVALGLALLPVEAFGSPPSWSELVALAPWLVLAAVGFLIPVMWGILWGAQHMDPGRLGIL
ncbi:MAG: EamA family transporter, partial [Kiloniellales bacterium]|nr:EamA family transporter [Kiloniellales bacterium]